jgi:hypothetical protein
METEARKRAAWLCRLCSVLELCCRGLKVRSASRFGEAGRSLHRPGPLRGAKPCRLVVARGCSGLHDGVARRPISHRGNSEGYIGVQPAVFSRSAGWHRGRSAAPAPTCFWGTPRESRICACDCSIEGVLAERYTAAVSNFYPPFGSLTFFGAAGNAFGCNLRRTTHLQLRDYSSSGLSSAVPRLSELGALRDHAWMKS